MSKKFPPEIPNPSDPATPAHARDAWFKNPLVYFAALSACAAVTSAFAALTNLSVARSNLEVARGQAAITQLQYTPQLALNIDQPKLFQHPQLGKLVGANAQIKNVGNITVYNAEVAAEMTYVAPEKISEVWAHMNQPEKGITLAPTEDETLSVSYFAPTPEQLAQMQAIKLVLVAAGRITFTDDLGRSHSRYTCGQIGAVGDRLVGKFCPTPPQN